MERLTIEELIEHCDRQINRLPSGNKFYQEHESVRAYLQMLRHYIATGLMPERVAELAQAERDGRLVVLPCNARDTVWVIEPLWIATICDKESKCRKCEHFYEGGMGDTPCCLKEEEECLVITEKTATLSDIAEWMERKSFGKSVFLTSDEAEAALDRREEAEK